MCSEAKRRERIALATAEKRLVAKRGSTKAHRGQQESRKSSDPRHFSSSCEISGLGIFAAHSFRAGERIRHINVLREVTPEQPIREDLGERWDHCSYPDGKVLLLGFPDRHVNHSCDPNVHELFEGTSSYIVDSQGYRIGRRDHLGLQHQHCERNVLAVSVQCSSMSWSCRRRFLSSSKGMAAGVSTAACRMVRQAAP